jgi:hypothetical protein
MVPAQNKQSPEQKRGEHMQQQKGSRVTALAIAVAMPLDRFSDQKK